MRASSRWNTRIKPDSENGDHPRHDLPKLPEEQGIRRVILGKGLALALVGLLCIGSAIATAAFLIQIQGTLKVSGRLEPAEVQYLRAPVSGRLLEVYVQSGDRVEEGTLLARFDPLELAREQDRIRLGADKLRRDSIALELALPMELRVQEEAVQEARASVVSARAEILLVMTDYQLGSDVDSLMATYEPGQSISLDRAVSALRAAEARERSAEERIQLLEHRGDELRGIGDELREFRRQQQATVEDMGRLEIFSVGSGMILTEDLGQLPGKIISQGDVVFEVSDLQAWQVRSNVPEREVHRVRQGDSVQILIPALSELSEEPMLGEVEFIGARPPAQDEVVQVPGQYRVDIRLEIDAASPEVRRNLRPGLSVEATILTGEESLIRRLRAFLRLGS